MKKIILIILLVAPIGLFAQSTGIRALKNRFKGEENVHSFKLAGFLARTAFKMAGEYEYKNAVTDIRSIEMITIPQEQFKEHQVTVRGYKLFLKENFFEELMEVKDRGEVVSVYTTGEGSKNERYLIVIDGVREVTVIELRGHIDPTVLAETKINTTDL